MFRRYGSSFESVDADFESVALNEIGFRRNGRERVPLADFELRYERVAVHELEAEADGAVQDHTEQLVLARLEERLRALASGLGPDEVLVVENESGRDYPKTRQSTKNVVVGGENKLHFHLHVDPPLRIGVYRRKAAGSAHPS